MRGFVFVPQFRAPPGLCRISHFLFSKGREFSPFFVFWLFLVFGVAPPLVSGGETRFFRPWVAKKTRGRPGPAAEDTITTTIATMLLPWRHYCATIATSPLLSPQISIAMPILLNHRGYVAIAILLLPCWCCYIFIDANVAIVTIAMIAAITVAIVIALTVARATPLNVALPITLTITLAITTANAII